MQLQRSNVVDARKRISITFADVIQYISYNKYVPWRHEDFIYIYLKTIYSNFVFLFQILSSSDWRYIHDFHGEEDIVLPSFQSATSQEEELVLAGKANLTSIVTRRIIKL